MSDLSKLTPGVWTVDASHSTIGFVVRHLVVAKVRGSFDQFEGKLDIAADPLDSTLTASVQTASINTRDEARDAHLRGADFFDVERFPTLSLASTGIEPSGSSFKLHTDLTIKGITKPVTFDLEYEGVATDPWGNVKAGFEAQAEINRKDWGLDWNAVLEAGGLVVGEKVKLVLEVEALKA